MPSIKHTDTLHLIRRLSYLNRRYGAGLPYLFAETLDGYELTAQNHTLKVIAAKSPATQKHLQKAFKALIKNGQTKAF